jgi:hypothetical protein
VLTLAEDQTLGALVPPLLQKVRERCGKRLFAEVGGDGEAAGDGTKISGKSWNGSRKRSGVNNVKGKGRTRGGRRSCARGSAVAVIRGSLRPRICEGVIRVGRCEHARTFSMKVASLLKSLKHHTI